MALSCSKILAKKIHFLQRDPNYNCAYVIFNWHHLIGESLAKLYKIQNIAIRGKVAQCSILTSSSGQGKFPYYKQLLDTKLCALLKVGSINFIIKGGGHNLNENNIADEQKITTFKNGTILKNRQPPDNVNVALERLALAIMEKPTHI